MIAALNCLLWSFYRMNPKPGRASSLLLPIGLLLIAMVSIQSGASLAKSLFPVIGAPGTTALRLALASILMLAVLRPWRTPFSSGSLRTIILYGIALGAMNLLFYMAINRIPLGIGVALEFTGPLAVAMYHSRRLVDFIWIALAVTGLALLIPMGQTDNLDMVGVAYALGAGVCWAAYIVFGQKAGNEHGVQTSAWGVLVAAICVAPIGIADAGSALFSPVLIPAAIGLAILSTALPLSLEMVAMTKVPARTFGTLMSMEPAIGALSGLIFLQEHLSLTQWLAILAIIIASAGATLTSRAPQPVLVCAD
jgi:inner membrane transporter RhtA